MWGLQCEVHAPTQVGWAVWTVNLSILTKHRLKLSLHDWGWSQATLWIITWWFLGSNTLKQLLLRCQIRKWASIRAGARFFGNSRPQNEHPYSKSTNLKDPFAGKCIKNHIVNVTLFFKSVGKILILLQICYKLISRLFRSHRTRKFGLKIFPTNLTPSNHEIKILKTPNFACFFSKTILKITFWSNIFCELVLRSR